MDNIKEELRQTATLQLPDPIISMAYVEHQIDLLSKIVLDLAKKVDLTDEEQSRVAMLESIMQHSSIDFKQIQHPLQAYKIPKTVEYKGLTRNVQLRYLQAQMREGIFGK